MMLVSKVHVPNRQLYKDTREENVSNQRRLLQLTGLMIHEMERTDILL